jgi:hypothetical protein
VVPCADGCAVAVTYANALWALLCSPLALLRTQIGKKTYKCNGVDPATGLGTWSAAAVRGSCLLGNYALPVAIRYRGESTALVRPRIISGQRWALQIFV